MAMNVLASEERRRLQIEKVVADVRSTFSDFKNFEKRLNDLLRYAMDEASQKFKDFENSRFKTQKAVDGLLNDVKIKFEAHIKKSFDKSEMEEVFCSIRFACVLLLEELGHGEQLKMDKEQFFKKYTGFNNKVRHDSELDELLMFRNGLALAKLMLPPYRNKDKLWNLACRYANEEYIRGSGATKICRLCEEIYKEECGIVNKKRPARSVSDDSESSSIDENDGGSIGSKRPRAARQATPTEGVVGSNPPLVGLGTDAVSADTSSNGTVFNVGLDDIASLDLDEFDDMHFDYPLNPGSPYYIENK